MNQLYLNFLTDETLAIRIDCLFKLLFKLMSVDIAEERNEWDNYKRILIVHDNRSVVFKNDSKVVVWIIVRQSRSLDHKI